MTSRHRLHLLPTALLLLATAALVSAPAARAQADDTPSANPARPTVTNPATLPPVGYLQFEQGYLGSLNSPQTASQYGADQVTKIAVHPRVMVEAQFQPFAVSRIPGSSQTQTGFGDVLLGSQIVVYAPRAVEPPAGASKTDAAPQKSRLPTIAVGYLGRVHDGTTPDVDMGGFSQSLVLFVSGDLGSFHYDSNYIVNEQSGSSNIIKTRTVHRAQFAQTLSVNHPFFNPSLQLSVELYHFTQPVVSADGLGRPVPRANLVDLLLAFSYQLRPNLVLDAGFSHGFTSTSTQWQSFAGFTYLLPHRLWSAHKK